MEILEQTTHTRLICSHDETSHGTKRYFSNIKIDLKKEHWEFICHSIVPFKNVITEVFSDASYTRPSTTFVKIKFSNLQQTKKTG